MLIEYNNNIKNILMFDIFLTSLYYLKKIFSEIKSYLTYNNEYWDFWDIKNNIFYKLKKNSDDIGLKL